MNRRRQKLNPIDAPSLARWIVIFTFLAATGLSYVYLSVQLHTLGNNRTAIEKELVAVDLQTKEARVQIAALTSRPALERRLQEGYLKMIHIEDGAIVKLTPHPRNGDAVQPVANEQGSR
jgi:hypothetical protein